MEIRDNRMEHLIGVSIAKGGIVSIYVWKGGMTITLDTGYSVVLKAQEVKQIQDAKTDE